MRGGAAVKANPTYQTESKSLDEHRADLLKARAPLSSRLLRARVATLQAVARFDALSQDPAAVAWVEVVDALYALVTGVTP